MLFLGCLLASCIVPVFADSPCRCAPLASCVAFANGSFGCHCPFFGDGVVTCSEQRFVTHATVRVKQDAELQSWLGHLGRTPTAVSWRKLLSTDSQVVIELDSTDYDGMKQLTADVNMRGWAYEVALLGTATSQVALAESAMSAMQSAAAHLEVVNVTLFNSSIWEFELVVSEGVIFLASEVKALPCVHVKGPCCLSDLAWSPYSLGKDDLVKSIQTCNPFATETGKQPMATQSSIEKRADGTALVRVHESDLGKLASGRDPWNLSVGLMVPGELPVATQTFISLRRSSSAVNYTIGSFKRQVAQYLLLQLEQVHAQTYARLWARISLENATVVFAQYAWADMDWIVPRCVNLNETCYDVPPVCTAQAKGAVLELWVPVHDWSESKGNLTLYIVVQQGGVLARIMTQVRPAIMAKHCPSAVQVNEAVEIQIMQGLTLTQIYRGPAQALLELGMNAQTDVLITFVARSSAGLILEELQAIHAHTEEQRALVMANVTCANCVVEQLVLGGRVVSPRSCHVFGSGDDLLWIQQYVGLVGSSLAVDVLGRVPPDVRMDPVGVSAAWINPVWPWNNDSIVVDMTFLHARFSPRPRVGGRRLMAEQPVISKQMRTRPEFILVAIAAASSLLWIFMELSGISVRSGVWVLSSP